MYISKVNGFKGLDKRYASGGVGGYSGLGSIWGEAKENSKSPAETIALLKQAAKGKVDPNPVDQIQEELPPSVSIDAPVATILDPKDFISKPRRALNAFQAMQVLTRPHGARGGSDQRIKGKVYWTPEGPKFSQTPIIGGKTAENVPPPAIKLRPNVQVVRDLPVVPGLEPIEVPAKVDAKSEAKPSVLSGAFGEATNKWPALLVLGLLLLILTLN